MNYLTATFLLLVVFVWRTLTRVLLDSTASFLVVITTSEGENSLRSPSAPSTTFSGKKCGCNMFILHRFPADGDLRRQWVSAVNRQGFSPTEAARVCSRHFVDGKRTEENPVPMLALGYHRKVRAFCLSPCAYLLCVRQPSTLKLFTRYEAARWLSGPRR